MRFQVDDATQEWAFPPESFDFIHARGMAGSIRDWPELLRQAYMYGIGTRLLVHSKADHYQTSKARRTYRAVRRTSAYVL